MSIGLEALAAEERAARLDLMFDEGLICNLRSDERVVLWTQYGQLDMPIRHAKQFIKILIDSGVKVRSYWKDTGERERAIDQRILPGDRV